MLGNALIMAINLFPGKVSLGSGVALNDGWTILKARCLKKEDILKQIETHYLYEALSWRDRRNYERSKEAYEQALSRFPGSVTGKNDFGALLMSTGEFRRAWDIYHVLLNEECKNKYLELMIKNNFAYTTVVMGLTDYLGEADTFSKQVYDNLSWNADAKGTRGVVLIERGKIDEGISLLNQAIKLDDSNETVAAHLCHIGIGEARKGNITQAKACLRHINATCPECGIRPLIEKEMRLSGASV